MQAIVLSEYGDPNRLELRDRPEPEPGAGQIKVRVAAGEVVRVGAGVTEFKEGEQVLGLVNGAYAQYVVAGTQSWAKLPEGLAARDAGALPLVLLTGDQLA